MNSLGKIMNYYLATVAATLILSLFPLTASVEAEITCSLTQITNTTRPTNNDRGVISGDGSIIAIDSNGDLTGGNPDLNHELFLYDVSSESFEQVSDTTNPFRFVLDPSISGNGERVTFQSEANITPPGLNPGEQSQIYLFDSNTSMTSQISNITYLSHIEHDISGNGNTAAFVASGATFLSDVSSFPYRISRIRGFTASPSLNSNGSLVALTSSSSDLAPGNADGNQEIFLYNANTRRFTQVTDTTTVRNVFPKISSDGSHIVFISEADFTGDNPDSRQQKFLYNIDTGEFLQITDTTGPSIGYASNFTISADGSRVAFEEDFNIYIFDRGLMDRVRIVENGRWPSINGEGNKIAFISHRDLTGKNPDGNNEVFLAECDPPAPPRTSDNCAVRTYASPGGTINLPFPYFVPLCRCLEDRSVREFRCALFNPEFFMVFRFPSPIIAGKLFDMSLSFIPLTKLSGVVSIETSLPQNFKFAGNASSGIKFPLGSPIDKAAGASLKYLAPEQVGIYPLKATVLIPGKKGQNVLDQEIEFNLPIGNQLSDK